MFFCYKLHNATLSETGAEDLKSTTLDVWVRPGFAWISMHSVTGPWEEGTRKQSHGLSSH